MPSVRNVGTAIGALLVLLTLGGHAVFDAGATQRVTPTATASVPGAAAVPELPAGEVANFPWLIKTDDGRPARWPCGPIGYRLVSSGAPAGADALLTEAFSRISAVSGYQFRADASVPGPPIQNDSYRGIEVSWVAAKDFPVDFRDEATIGVGGAWSNDGHLTGGYVRLRREWRGSGATDFGARSVGPIVLHELGHALGLSHIDDKAAIMYPTDQGVTDWSPREQAALRYLRRSCG